YGYKIVDKIEHDTECFISNSHEIFKIEQGVPSKHIKSYSKESRKRPIPAFLFEHYVDKSALYTSSPSEKLQQKTQETEYAINVGKLTHKILEYFVPMKRIINKNEVKDFIEIYKENAALKFTTKQINNICVLANDYLLPIAKNGELKTELKIKRRYKLNNNHYIMSGIIDLLILTDKEAHIIDYKTDKIVPDTHLDIELKYLKQMCSYKEMISNIYTDHKIICHLAWTHKPTLIKIEESQLETKDLEST
ncbi:MAG: PD-(D/E)XK nuclease family protein, partial [Alphaproteobacteria bacterium]|nr:PD-(D/E)XK nuclease family protein [Alphaproteobacteria bacterium]